MNTKISIYEDDDENPNKSLTLGDFIKGDRIGSGTFGKVYKVIEKNSKKIYAAKILRDEIRDDSEQTNSDISREINILTKLNYPTVLRFICFSPFNFKHKAKPTIITEYASNGTLLDFIENERSDIPQDGWDDTTKLIIAYGISSAMEYLHNNEIIHRDLKPANILIDEYMIPKIADFGLSKMANNDQLLQTFTGATKGTPIYMAPEIWERNEYTKFSDVYAYSLILYEIFTGERLFEGCISFQIPIKIIRGYRPPFNEKISPAYKDLIERCWRKIPYARPTFDQIKIDLKTNPNFITEKVDSDKFFRFVKYIDGYESSFNKFNSVDLSEILKRIKPSQSENFKLKIDYKLKLFPFNQFIKLVEDESISLVKEAENDLEKQFIVAKCLIESENDFPFDVQLGIKYLKKSMKSGYEQSTVHYIKMIIKGKVIPKNHEKALKLIGTLKNYDKNLLYGKLYKNEKRYEEAKKCLIESIKEGNYVAMYEYGKMHTKGQGFPCNEEEGAYYYKMSIDTNENFLPALFRYSEYLHNKKDPLEETFLKKAADQGNAKACGIYGLRFQRHEYVMASVKKGYTKVLSEYKYFLLYDPESKKCVRNYLYKKAADKGNMKCLYYYCRNLPQSEEYVRYIRIAANNKIPEAMSAYGEILLNGIFFPPDENEAFKYFKMACKYGDTSSLNSYALLLHNKKDNPINYDEIVQLFKKAIELGNSYSMYNYAYMLESGKGVAVNYEEAIKYYKMAIKKGETNSMVNYALMLINGKGVEVNYDEGIRYLYEAFRKGDTSAMYSLATIYKNGVGVTIDYEEAFKYYKMAADKGHIESMTFVACMFRNGEGTPINYEEAIKYFKMAIKEGDTDSMYYYANMLEKGEGMSKDIEEALKYYKMAADKGDTDAMCVYADKLANGIDMTVNYEEALKYIKKAIEKGSSTAEFLYGCMLKKGNGVPVNNEESLKYFKSAADKGNIDAMNNYGSDLLEGNDYSQNQEEGKKYLKMAADCGNIYAMHNYACALLGDDYDHSKYEEAIKYLKIAAEKGESNSINMLSFLLLKGREEFIDYEDAIKYLKKSIENGNADAMFEYACMLFDGKGITTNIEEAIKYFKMSADNGNSDAMFKYGCIMSDDKVVPADDKEAMKYFKMASDKGVLGAKERYEICKVCDSYDDNDDTSLSTFVDNIFKINMDFGDYNYNENDNDSDDGNDSENANDNDDGNDSENANDNDDGNDSENANDNDDGNDSENANDNDDGNDSENDNDSGDDNNGDLSKLANDIDKISKLIGFNIRCDNEDEDDNDLDEISKFFDNISDI